MNGKISGTQIDRKWHFQASESKEPSSAPLHIPAKKQPHEEMTVRRFEIIAREKFSDHFQTRLTEKSVPGVGKKWDMVSPGDRIIGDAKYYTLVRGKNLPPAKFSVIAEHIWILEKTDADIKFLAFGNQVEVPKLW